MTPSTYTRPDGVTMHPVAAHQFVSEATARRLGLLGRPAR